MGRDAHDYVKSRTKARKQLAEVGKPADFLVESSLGGRATRTDVVPNRRRKLRYRMIGRGFLPAGSLLEQGVDLTGCPLQKLVREPGTEGFGDTLDEVWVPAWVAAIAMRYLDVPTRSRLVREALNDVKKQIVLCSTALLTLELEPDYRRALRVWVARAGKKSEYKA